LPLNWLDCGGLNLDDVEINGEMVAIYEVNDVFVAALAALAEPPAATIPPDVRETLRGALLIADQSGINKMRSSSPPWPG
jgi:hypothetical protein